MFGDELRGAELPVAELGVLVDVAAPGDDLWLDCRDAGLHRLLQVGGLRAERHGAERDADDDGEGGNGRAVRHPVLRGEGPRSWLRPRQLANRCHRSLSPYRRFTRLA